MAKFFFTDGSDLKGVKESTEIKYMKLLKFELQTLSSWPEKLTKLGIIENLFILTQSCTCLPLILIYLINGTGSMDFFRLGHVYITFFMNCVALSRLFLPLMSNYKKLSIFFINDLHLFYHRNKSEYSTKIHLQVHKISHFFTTYLSAMMLGGIIMFNTIPIYNNFAAGAFKSENSGNVTFEHAVYYALPFEYESNENGYNGYLVVVFLNWYISYFCSSCFCIVDLFLSLMIFHLWGHLKILIHNLEVFPRPRACEDKGLRSLETMHIMYSNDETPRITQLLIEQVKYHKYILDFATSMSETFGWILFIYYAFHQVSGCLLLLECSQLDTQALIRYGPLTIILFQQLIQLSIIFEMISSMCEKLKDAAYSIPWECMGLKNRKIFHFFLKNVQIPIHVKAMGVADVGVQTMASIIKTSLSYFAFLRTMPETN